MGIEALGLRDDAGVMTTPSGDTLVASVDSVVEGVHVDLDLSSPSDLGWKAMMGALSDLAAMGAEPLGALVALCVPGGSGSGELALGVMGGVAEASDSSACPVIGGDVSSSGQVVVAVTVFGTVERDGPPPVSRSGGRPGDVVLVTGPCGASAAALRALRAPDEALTDEAYTDEAYTDEAYTDEAYTDEAYTDEAYTDEAYTDEAYTDEAYTAYRRPVARLREGVLARRAGVRAMIDVSDGLALDLHRLADSSGVGFRLDAVPMARGATMEEALGGGEDYELIMVVAEEAGPALSARLIEAGLRPPIRIGTLVDDPGERLLEGHELARLGWQHRLG